MSRADRVAMAVVAAVTLPVLALLFLALRGWPDQASTVAALGLAGGLTVGMRVRVALSDRGPLRSSAPAVTPAGADGRPGASEGAAPETTDSNPIEIPAVAMAELANDGFLVVDAALTIVAVSPSFERLAGCHGDDTVGTPLSDILDAAASHAVGQRAARGLDGGADVDRLDHVDGWAGIDAAIEAEIEHPSGRSVLTEVTVTALDSLAEATGSLGEPTRGDDHLLVVVRDVTALRRLEASLNDRAVTDQSNGLASRETFEHEVQGVLRRLPADHRAAVINLAVLDFGDVRDAVGFLGGNQLLDGVAQRLRAALRGIDVMARFGQVEFAVIAIGPSEQSLLRFAERLAWLFEEPFEVDDRTHHLRVAVGLAITDDRETEADRLVQSASVAMHEAEQRAGDIVIHDQALQDQIDERFELTSALRPALHEGQFSLVYQPLLSLRTGKVVSFEALVRWAHPTRGSISPATFIPLAEKSGMIVELGRWVMEEACRQLVDWRSRLDGFDDVAIGVNLSARQLERHGELDALLYLVEGAGLDAESLVVELTESVMADDAGWVRSQLRHFRELGSRIAIDDFGTGVAGLSHLRELPHDVVKIDRSYVERVGQDPIGENLVAQIIDLARGLGATSVAEGVETEIQARRLAEMGCDIGQGFHLARPMARAGVEQWMAEHLARRPDEPTWIASASELPGTVG